MDEIESFLKANNELLHSDENIHPKIVGNYTLDRDDVSNQVVDWVLNFLENRKYPYQLAISVAKSTAQEIDASISKQAQENGDLDTEKVLNSWNLYSEAIKKLPSMCNSFLEQAKEQEMLSSCFAPYTASIFAIKNKRRKMEDRHVIHHDLNLLLDLENMPAHSYYAVFDGHSGVDAASYASAHLHVNIAKHPAFLTDTTTAISEAYKVTDENFLKRCNIENIKSGSTAVCALIRERTIYLSWLGDSQAVLVKEGKPAIVTNPHKPEREDEQKRIEDLGGHITQMGVWRVNGVLAVTRALGDPDHKPYISNEPDVTTIHLDGSEDFLILACDGLWDGMSPEDVTTALYYNLSDSALDEPLDAVAAKLVHQSKLQGSEDNITAIVVFLRDIKDIKEYATKLAQESCSQLNFLGMNGDGRALDEGECLQNAPCVKPTVLELNAASTKKLKNTANVLSSAGITDPSYSCPYPGSAVEGISYQNISTDNSIFIHHQNAASCLPPEATALSELPTPPIDDILASQQFEKLCSDDLYQGLNAISPELHVSEPLTSSLNIDSEESVIATNPVSMDNVQESSLNITTETMSANYITPDEAMGIASCVVSNTIETAVKCLSSSELCQPVSPVSPQKLNPYAEPFVMRSFIPDDTQSKNESNKKDEPPNSDNNCPIPSLGEQKTIQKELDTSFDNSADVQCDNHLIDFMKNNVETALFQQNVFETSVQEQKGKVDVTISEEESKENLLVSVFSQMDLKSPKLSDGICPLDEPITTSVHLESVTPTKMEIPNALQDLEKNIIDPISSGNYTPEEAKNMCLASDVLPPLDNSFDSISLDKGNIEVCQPVSNLENQILCPFGISENAKNQSLISDTPVFPEKDNLMQSPNKTEDLNLDGSNSEFTLKAQEETISLDDQTTRMQQLNEPASEPVQNVSSIHNDHPNINSEGILLEDKSLLPDTTLVILESVTKDSLTLINIKDETKSTAAILPSDQADDPPLETFAVDLQSVPDGIPEAEGVTEDVDSDSEKDGGWSYMKGNTVGGTKPKPGEQTPKSEKPSSKVDSNSKVKKDVEKSGIDIKTKTRNVISVDKSKRSATEKKTLDIKEKRPARTVSSTLPKTTVDKGKPSSIISRVKKDAPTAKVVIAPSSKQFRPAATRTTAPLNKPGQNASSKEENNQVAQTKPLGTSSIAGSNKPKTASNTNGTKTSARPGTGSILLSRQPSNQSNKSNVAPTSRSATLNRPTASTVPSRILSKPAALSKPAPSESKPKQLPNTMKKTVPSTLKKPDVKEAKDIVNKQISARSNAAVGMLNKNAAIKNATTSNKLPTTLGSKPVATKPRSAPIKNDTGKKDVPKAPISKLTSKTNVPPKMSRDLTKREVTKSVNIQEKKIEKKTDLASKDAEKTTEITPVCEEKFILEVNDKEIFVKEHGEIASNSEQVHIPVENGIAENVKPVEEIVPVANSALENLL